MNKIIAIVGESGSGKDTFANMLSEATGYPIVVSYTTRPMRPGETQGEEHYFTSFTDYQVNAIRHSGAMLTYTKYGNYHYWTLKTQISTDVIYIIDEVGLKELKEEHSNKYDIKTILIKRANKENVGQSRLERDKNRELLSESMCDILVHNDSTLENLKLKAIEISCRIMK